MERRNIEKGETENKDKDAEAGVTKWEMYKEFLIEKQVLCALTDRKMKETDGISSVIFWNTISHPNRRHSLPETKLIC